jgi:hypothetical protein
MALIRGFVFLVVGLCLQPSFAASSKKNEEKIFDPAPVSAPAFTEEEYKAVLEKSKKARSIAQADSFDYASAYSDDAKNLLSRINGGPLWANRTETKEVKSGLKTVGDIDEFITYCQANYASMKPDAQFVAAYWIALKPWKGFFHRARKLVESHNLSQSAIVTFLRAVNSTTNVFLAETPSYKVGFDYLTMPAKDLDHKIANENDLRRFVQLSVMPAYEALIQKLRALNFENGIYFDNKLILNNANAATGVTVDTRDRHVRLGEPERLAALSGVLLAYSNLSGALAYRWTGFFKAMDSVGTVYGFSSGLSDGSMTAEKRFNIVKRDLPLFTLIKPGGPELIKNTACPKFKEGLRAANASWIWLKRLGGDNQAARNIFDPRAFIPFTRTINESFKNIDKVVLASENCDMKGSSSLASALVAGEVIDVNFAEFFNNPPDDLKSFFPKTFTGGGNRAIDTATGEEYRNYSFGNPETWDANFYGRFFPNVRSQNDVRKAARILNQTWGGWMLGIPLAGMTM